MTLLEKKPTAAGHGLAEVELAAISLQGQACTLSARHIQDGMLRLHFNREVGDYAQGILRDVKAGHKSPEEGLKAIQQAQQSLFNRSMAALKKSTGLIAGFAQMTAALMFCGKTSKWTCGVTSTTLVFHGVNNTMENTRNLKEGRADTEGPVRVFYQETSLMPGGSRLQGTMAYGTADIGLSVYGAFRTVPDSSAWKLWYYFKNDCVQGYKNASGLSLLIDAAGTAVTMDALHEELNKHE